MILQRSFTGIIKGNVCAHIPVGLRPSYHLRQLVKRDDNNIILSYHNGTGLYYTLLKLAILNGNTAP